MSTLTLILCSTLKVFNIHICITFIYVHEYKEMDSQGTLKRRHLPKLMACMTKNSLENLRNRALFSLDALDAKGIRR